MANAAKTKLMPTTESFDPETAMRQVDNDADLFKEIVGIFREDYPQYLAKIDNAIAQGNAHDLEHYAHSLKGAVGNLGARQVYEIALNLEITGRSGALEKAPENINLLKQELTKFEKELLEYSKTL